MDDLTANYGVMLLEDLLKSGFSQLSALTAAADSQVYSAGRDDRSGELLKEASSLMSAYVEESMLFPISIDSLAFRLKQLHEASINPLLERSALIRGPFSTQALQGIYMAIGYLYERSEDFRIYKNKHFSHIVECRLPSLNLDSYRQAVLCANEGSPYFSVSFSGQFGDDLHFNLEIANSWSMALPDVLDHPYHVIFNLSKGYVDTGSEHRYWIKQQDLIYLQFNGPIDNPVILDFMRLGLSVRNHILEKAGIHY